MDGKMSASGMEIRLKKNGTKRQARVNHLNNEGKKSQPKAVAHVEVLFLFLFFNLILSGLLIGTTAHRLSKWIQLTNGCKKTPVM